MSDTPTKPITLGIRPSGYKRIAAIASERGMNLCDVIEVCALAFIGAAPADQDAAIAKQVKHRPKRKRRAAMQL